MINNTNQLYINAKNIFMKKYFNSFKKNNLSFNQIRFIEKLVKIPKIIDGLNILKNNLSNKLNNKLKEKINDIDNIISKLEKIDKTKLDNNNKNKKNLELLDNIFEKLEKNSLNIKNVNIKNIEELKKKLTDIIEIIYNLEKEEKEEKINFLFKRFVNFYLPLTINNLKILLSINPNKNSKNNKKYIELYCNNNNITNKNKNICFKLNYSFIKKIDKNNIETYDTKSKNLISYLRKKYSSDIDSYLIVNINSYGNIFIKNKTFDNLLEIESIKINDPLINSKIILEVTEKEEINSQKEEINLQKEEINS
jgi:hypothetical protein